MPADLQTIVQRMIDAGESEDNIATVIKGYQPSTVPLASSLTGMIRTMAPDAIQGMARGVADHPRLAQNVIDASSRAAAGGVGGLIAGEPGAVVGALAMKGMTPTQGAIRTVAGQMAGEAPEVARHAGRAMGVINYGREQGIKLTPGNLASVPENPALDNYAASQGQKVIRLFGPTGPAGTPGTGVQVVGPMTPIDAAAPSLASKVVPAITRGLGYLQVGTGVTDLARMLEPNRQDIGVMGIGSHPPPTVTTVQIAGPNGQIGRIAQGAMPPQGWTVVNGSAHSDANDGQSLAGWMGAKSLALRDAILQRLQGQPSEPTR